MTSRILLSLLLLLVGCGEPLSNQLLLEDDLFREALPSTEDVGTSVPGASDEDDAARELGERAEMVDITVSVSALYNGIVFSLLRMVDRVTELDVTRREQDRRIWGPYAGDRGGSSVRVVVDRADDALFSYSVEVASVGPLLARADDTRWEVLMSGVFESGESLELGQGEFMLDFGVWGLVDNAFAERSGVVRVGHGRGPGGISLDVVAEQLITDDAIPRDAVYTFRGGLETGGFFEYETTDGDQSYLVRSRWTAERTGRADFEVTGGDLGDLVVPGSECWDGALERTWYLLDPVGTAGDQEEGTEDSCVFGYEAPGSTAPEL